MLPLIPPLAVDQPKRESVDWVDDTESSLNPAPIDISSINLGPAIQKARRLNFFFCIVCLLSLLMAGVCLSVSCCIAAFTPQPKNKVTYIGLWDPNLAPLTPEEQAALDRLDRENAKVDAMRGCGVSCSLAMLGFVVLGLSYPLFHARLRQPPRAIPLPRGGLCNCHARPFVCADRIRPELAVVDHLAPNLTALSSPAETPSRASRECRRPSTRYSCNPFSADYPPPAPSESRRRSRARSGHRAGESAARRRAR